MHAHIYSRYGLRTEDDKKKKKKSVPRETFETAFVRKSTTECKNQKNSTKKISQNKKKTDGVAHELAARLKAGKTVSVIGRHLTWKPVLTIVFFSLWQAANK